MQASKLLVNKKQGIDLEKAGYYHRAGHSPAFAKGHVKHLRIFNAGEWSAQFI